MPVVVSLAGYKNRGTLTAVRELLVLAAKGQIAGLRFDALLKDGKRRRGVTGDFMPSQAPEIDPDLISLPVRLCKD